MSAKIRRQSIISSIVIYAGFAIGFLNTTLLGQENLFSSEENGLVSMLPKVAALIASLSAIAMPNYILKFYPYYKHRVDDDKNDMLSIALVVGITGFLVVFAFGYIFENLVVQKYSANSALFVDYYYWVYVLGFGLTVFNILEAYCQSIQKPVVATFLKEVEWRSLTLIFIILFATGIIKDYGLFIKLYALSYLGIALTMFIYLLWTGVIKFTFKISFVTLRIRKILLRFTSIVYLAFVVSTLSQVFDTMVIGSVVEDGLKNVAIFTLAEIMTSIIQAPQRGVLNVATAHLADAWKHKDRERVKRIYVRSSMNLLLASLFLYSLIALNFLDAIPFFNFRPEFATGYTAFLILGVTRIIDLGSGVNAQVIATSRHWRFALWSNVILLVFTLPFTYFFAKNYGIIGPAMAGLLSMGMYNCICIYFVWKKFGMFPFNIKTIYNIVLAGVAFFITWIIFRHLHGFWALAGRTVLFSAIYITGVYYFKFSPDVMPVLNSLKDRLPFLRKRSG